jgi:hypothetical protein
MRMRLAAKFTLGSLRFRPSRDKVGTNLGLLLTAPIIKLGLQITTSRQA